MLSFVRFLRKWLLLSLRVSLRNPSLGVMPIAAKFETLNSRNQLSPAAKPPPTLVFRSSTTIPLLPLSHLPKSSSPKRPHPSTTSSAIENGKLSGNKATFSKAMPIPNLKATARSKPSSIRETRMWRKSLRAKRRRGCRR
ncbi:hypothetical protein DEO72_LG1g624 [Vigna unguiculata]|uniref:Uncharacterized protein n=1 Tax=Vigna unguiculata TaxID=3917 RepID=A0A4D6KIB6_VIGUN|nr:hypothetical protein DEO72_LG1g624 [Vigna unguiculata]